MRSAALNETFWLDYCRRIFNPYLSMPSTNITNLAYGALNNTGNHIFFFNAIEDPWKYAGMDMRPDPITPPVDIHQENFLINCTDCGHCIDLHAPTGDEPQELVLARQEA